MFIRLQNSCTYTVLSDYFEIRSDVFNKAFRFKGIPPSVTACLLEKLQQGVKEDLLIDILSIRSTPNEAKIIEIVTFLKTKGMLIESDDLSVCPPQDTLYDRQIRFLDSFETNTLNGFDFNKKLQNSKVVIIGLGAYGSWLALHCARLGIQNITGIDHDIVEVSNLHRQVLYMNSDVGISKAEASSKIINATDNSIQYQGICKKIENETDLVPYLEKADLVFNAFGYYPEEEAKDSISGFITKASIITKTPMLCLSTNWMGPLYVPGKSACYFCAVNQATIKILLKKPKKNPRVEKRAFCPILSITCSFAALEAVRYLTGIDAPSTINGLASIDPFFVEKSTFFPIGIDYKCRYCQ